MITLYYVEGLTQLDEPMFESLSSQEKYFDNYVVQRTDAGFYPPHYQNRITLSTEDITFASNCNYLSLDYGSKTYYYFIDSIEYVSEDVIQLNVIMDVIQTYMFNMNIRDMHITRRSIKRWNDDGTINRQYVRENLSRADMARIQYKKQHDDICWYLVWFRDPKDIKVRDGIDIVDWNPGSECHVKSSWTNYSIGLKAFFIPVYKGVLNIEQVYIKDSGGVFRQCQFPWRLLEDPYVVKMYYIDYDIFKGQYSTEYLGNILHITMTDSAWVKDLYYQFTDSTARPISAGYAPNTVDLSQSSTKVSWINFIKNTSKTNTVSIAYVPALLDENYYQYEYGEQLSTTTYPLHELQKPTLYENMLFDITSCSRMYYLSQDEETGKVNDPYGTLIVNNTQELVDLYSDKWLQYYSSNSATWTEGYTLNKNKLLFKYTLSQVNTVMDGASDYAKGRPMYKSVMGFASNLANHVWNMYELDKQREITKGNLTNAPDMEKQGNAVNPDLVSGALDIVRKLYRVRDIERVSYEFERYGYTVNDTVQNAINTSIFGLNNNRYYFNVLQGTINSLTFNGVITDDNTKGAVMARFASGLRMWNTDNGVLRASAIGDFTYDNVETSFITEE